MSRRSLRQNSQDLQPRWSHSCLSLGNTFTISSQILPLYQPPRSHSQTALFAAATITTDDVDNHWRDKQHIDLSYKLSLLLYCRLVLLLLLTFAQPVSIPLDSRQPSIRASSMARVYADVNQHMPRSYWDYDSVNISWGILENYEIVRKIGGGLAIFLTSYAHFDSHFACLVR